MREKETCEICGKVIRTMVFRGTGYCGEQHRKQGEEE